MIVFNFDIIIIIVSDDGNIMKSRDSAGVWLVSRTDLCQPQCYTMMMIMMMVTINMMMMMMMVIMMMMMMMPHAHNDDDYYCSGILRKSFHLKVFSFCDKLLL